MAGKNLLNKHRPNVGLYHYYHSDFYYSMPDLQKNRKMTGVNRVIVFCILIVILPATLIIIPLYLRKTVFADVTYPVAESDIIEIRDGISSIFCQQHSLRMSSNFNAFQLRSRPEISTHHKHIRLKKSMTLPDDTLEYWGFYLLKGAKVHLKFCSRYDGSRILVVKGQRNLKTCGLLDHNKNKVGANFAQGHEQVKVFFEDITEINERVSADDLNAMAHQEHTTPDDKDAYMEVENHGGEDLSDDEDEKETKADGMTNTTPIPTTTKRSARLKKQARKKLKKGTIGHEDNSTKKSEEATTPQIGSVELLISRDQPPENMGAAGNSSETNENTTRSSAELEDEAFLLKHLSELERKRQEVYDQLYKKRTKREHIYDRRYSHGGNAVNFTETDESNSISSFENGLFDCYNGDILLAEGFPPSADCLNTRFLDSGTHRMLSKHEITQDGYYYYIFYSDNDLVRNDIHAIFDIYKPTFQYSNISDSQICVNATNCTFPIGFLSDEIVVVEVPTRDGIEHEEDDITYLISTCHPRVEIYAIFPITVLILILGCSFL